MRSFDDPLVQPPGEVIRLHVDGPDDALVCHGQSAAADTLQRPCPTLADGAPVLRGPRYPDVPAEDVLATPITLRASSTVSASESSSTVYVYRALNGSVERTSSS